MVSWHQRVHELEIIILKQQEEIEILKRQLKSYENPNTPSSKKRKKNTERDNNKPRFPGKPEGSLGGGVELPPPDEVKEHKLDACPSCNSKLKEIGMRKHTTLDLPEKPIIVTEHRILKYFCKCCNKEVEAQLQNGIYGKRLQSLVILLKNMTNSHDKIASLIRELGAPSFSTAQVQAIASNYAAKLNPIRQNILDKIREALYLHADETGFRKDGRNGFIWGIFTKSYAIFSAEMSRAKNCITELLPCYKGVVVRDGYSVYNQFLTQRCWAHLLREFKELAIDNIEIDVQYKRVKLLYEQLKVLKEKPPNEVEIAKAKWLLTDITTCLNSVKQGRKLVTYIENGGDEWFTALYYKDVPLDNNLAERELRSVVLLRKVIGCYRNDKGKQWIDIVMSVLHTWKLQKLNIFQQLCALP
jgi:transposase